MHMHVYACIYDANNLAITDVVFNLTNVNVWCVQQ